MRVLGDLSAVVIEARSRCEDQVAKVRWMWPPGRMRQGRRSVYFTTRIDGQLMQDHIGEFISQHRLPDSFHKTIADHYSRITTWLVEKRQQQTFLLGISGAQGTGKSTLADYLRRALQVERGWQVAVLSIDDFYLTKVEREQLAGNVHSLLRTRGVPGTHDLPMLADCISKLRNLDASRSIKLPRFDKAVDDRADSGVWPVVTGPVDLIILEGWCVGSTPETGKALLQPINVLEEQMDSSGDWRRYVNMQLKGPYADLFGQLDALIFLKAPNFDAIHRWRVEQEEKLARSTDSTAPEIMSSIEIEHFIQHFERLTKANLETLPGKADIILELDDNHDCVHSIYTKPNAST